MEDSNIAILAVIAFVLAIVACMGSVYVVMNKPVMDTSKLELSVAENVKDISNINEKLVAFERELDELDDKFSDINLDVDLSDLDDLKDDIDKVYDEIDEVDDDWKDWRKEVRDCLDEANYTEFVDCLE